MQKKALGNTDIKVSVAGFGVLPMGPSQLALPGGAGCSGDPLRAEKRI